MAGGTDCLAGGLPPGGQDDPGGKSRRGSDCFVSFVRGWEPLRPDDCGTLWEHLVLEHLQANFPDTPPRYWRDKAGREVDFVVAHRRDQVDAIECKWNPDAFDGAALKTFRSYYPHGRNFLVTPSGDPAYTKRFGDLDVRICTPTELVP